MFCRVAVFAWIVGRRIQISSLTWPNWIIFMRNTFGYFFSRNSMTAKKMQKNGPVSFYAHAQTYFHLRKYVFLNNFWNKANWMIFIRMTFDYFFSKNSMTVKTIQKIGPVNFYAHAQTFSWITCQIKRIGWFSWEWHSTTLWQGTQWQFKQYKNMEQ